MSELQKLQIEELKKIVEMVEKTVHTDLSDWELLLDSANFQAKTKEDFAKFAQTFEAAGFKFLQELSHAGRKINVYQIVEDKLPEFFGLKFIELSEPKPGSQLFESGWEHVSYIVTNYDEFLEAQSKNGSKLQKVRTIGATKFCYYAPIENTIQFRNRSIAYAENIDPGETVETDGANGTDEAESNVSDGMQSIANEKELRLKLMADFENYRRTTERRIEHIQMSAAKDFVIRLIEIVDDFERGLNSVTGLIEQDGIKSIYEKLKNLIGTEGFEEIVVSTGTKFDPSYMEAVSTVPAASQEEVNTVMEVIQKAYKNINTGETLRSAKVVVAMK